MASVVASIIDGALLRLPQNPRCNFLHYHRHHFTSSPLSPPQIISSQISTQMTSKSVIVSYVGGGKKHAPPVYPQQLPVMPLNSRRHHIHVTPALFTNPTASTTTNFSTTTVIANDTTTTTIATATTTDNLYITTSRWSFCQETPPPPPHSSPISHCADTSSQLSVSPATPPLNQHKHIKSGAGKPNRQLRKKCIVQDCTELVAPSMWNNHHNLHTQCVLPGSVPDDWLHENNMVTCSHCHHLVASTHLTSHQRKCATPRSNTNTQMDVFH